MALPDWIDRDRYPFKPDTLDTDAGQLSYVDEGSGPVVLFLHGNPTWSFMYRKAICELRGDYRCVAPDHLGFGLSDKPVNWSYRPWDHAANIRLLLDELQINRFSLVAHDWGGPIGLSAGLDTPDRLRSLGIMNTWMWSLEDRFDAWIFSRFFGGAVGRYLINQWNVFTDVIMKFGVARPDTLLQQVHSHYQQPFNGDGSKRGVGQFPADITEATDWLDALWDNRDHLADLPAFIAWGMKDPAFGQAQLDQWLKILDNPCVKRYSKSSHYLMEDAGDSVATGLKRFLDQIH